MLLRRGLLVDHDLAGTRGQWPDEGLSGLKRELGLAMENPRFGAPPRPNWITFPSLSISARVTRDAAFRLGNLGELAYLGRDRLVERRVSDASEPDVSKADFPLMTASEP